MLAKNLKPSRLKIWEERPAGKKEREQEAHPEEALNKL